jgi:hypothetical protein
MSGRFAILGPVFAACTSTATSPATCPGSCLADPTPHWICEQCSSDTDCPSGLSCVSRGNTTTSDIGPSESHGCRWLPPALDRGTLIDGFEAPTMEIQIVSRPDVRVAWIPPPQAIYVACAVFTCTPEFVAGYAQDAANGLSQPRQIVNADACMLRLYATDASALSLPIAGMPLRTRPPACTIEPTTARWERVFDFVAAGCWAYDHDVVVATSELVPLPVADVADALPELPGTSCTVDDTPCYHADDSKHSFFGACAAGICQPRCVGTADCEFASETLLDRGHAASLDWECRKLSASAAGVCVPRSAVNSPVLAE